MGQLLHEEVNSSTYQAHQDPMADSLFCKMFSSAWSISDAGADAVTLNPMRLVPCMLSHHGGGQPLQAQPTYNAHLPFNSAHLELILKASPGTQLGEAQRQVQLHKRLNLRSDRQREYSSDPRSYLTFATNLCVGGLGISSSDGE